MKTQSAKPNRLPRPGSRRRGFTLIEVLVVVSIVAVLALLVFLLSSRAINSAHKAVCVQNLRGIGNAIQAYSIEHNNRLPGPLNVGQSAVFNPRAPANTPQLANYIAPYLETLRDSDEAYLLENFGCPSQLKKIGAASVSRPPILYRMGHDRAQRLDGTRGFPWIWNNPAGTSARPWRLDEISPFSASRYYAMIEQDESMGGSWTHNGTPGPAHGNERMALFFDWSVRGIPAAEWPVQ